jgi:LPS export ABC transporter protein LptC
MNKKTVIQIFLIFLIFLISISFYLKYFKNSSKILESSLPEEKSAINQNNMSTFINNIDYASSDSSENRYQITADQAEIKIQNADLMFLTNVVAYVFIENSDTVKITSDFGEYNSKNYDTIFSKNVIIVYSGHKITGEYLDFSFLKNLGIITKNVIYNKDKTNLFADKIEMNLLTKDTKIFMNDVDEEVLIQGSK